MKNWYNKLSDQWKATIRSGIQAAVGTVLTGVLALFLKAQSWVDGGLVDWSQALSNFGRVIGTAVITFFTGLVTYFMNRGNKGATYTPVGE